MIQQLAARNLRSLPQKNLPADLGHGSFPVTHGAPLAVIEACIDNPSNVDDVDHCVSVVA
jgi:hypothetical protein